jgi:hypothetical protein
VHSYAKRFGVDRYSAYADLTAIGVTLPASDQRWAQRPASNPRRTASDDGSVEYSWIMLDGRRFFVAGFTPGGAPYGIFEDEVDEMNLGDLSEDDLLYDSLEDERELRDGRAADDDASF